MSTAMLNIPEAVARGDVVEIKILISHVMETGFRPGPDGRLIPRDIVSEVVCRHDGEEVFRAEFFPAVAANPFLAFHLRAETSGEIELVWRDQQGQEWRETSRLDVA